jgi:hypothetical protein
VYENRVGLDSGDGNRDGAYIMYANSNAELRDYIARDQYRSWEQNTEENSYRKFLDGNNVLSEGEEE